MGWGQGLDPITKKHLGIRCFRIGKYKVWARSLKDAKRQIRRAQKKDPLFEVTAFNPIITKKYREGIAISYYPPNVIKREIIDFYDYGDALDYMMGKKIKKRKK